MSYQPNGIFLINQEVYLPLMRPDGRPGLQYKTDGRKRKKEEKKRG